jgi:hypothetical protein
LYQGWYLYQFTRFCIEAGFLYQGTALAVPQEAFSAWVAQAFRPAI